MDSIARWTKAVCKENLALIGDPVMKYTISVINTEEKFREKFGSAPHWHISIPQNNETKPPAEKTRKNKSKRKQNKEA